MDAVKNFARSLVATAPSPANSGTSLVVTAGEGSLFPAVPFNAVIAPANALPLSNNSEIVRVTARTTDTLTITRSQEASSARTIAVGDQLFVGVTARVLTDLDAGATVDFNVGRDLSVTRHVLMSGGYFNHYGMALDSAVLLATATGDTQYRFQLHNNGTFIWTNGVSSTLAVLQCVAPGILQFSDTYVAYKVADAGSWALSVNATNNPGGPFAALMIHGNGKMEWSNGDQVFDVSLERPQAGYLQVNGSLAIGTDLQIGRNINMTGGLIYNAGGAFGNGVLVTRTVGDTQNRLTISNDGAFYWGSGSASIDVVLYRPQPGWLQLNGSLSIPGNLFNNGTQIVSPGATSVSLTVTGGPAQTADLQQWQASDNSIVARLKMDSTTGALFETARGELILGQTGATYGATRLTITNRGGLNGAMFEQLGSVDLIDFVFRTLTVYRNMRLEGRAYATYFGTPEFQFGVPGDPAVCVYDTGIGLRAPLATSVPLMVKGAASQTADLQQWQDSSFNLLLRIEKDGKISTGVANNPKIWLREYSGLPVFDVLMPFGGAFRATEANVFGSSDIFFQGIPVTLSGFTALEGFWSAGLVLSTGGYDNPISIRPNRVESAFFEGSGAGKIKLVLKGAAGQTADLQQWRDSTGAVLAWVDNLGKFRTNTGAVVITNDARLSDARMPIQQVVQAADITVNAGATSPANSTLTFAQSGTYYVMVSWMSRHATNNGKYTFRFKSTGGTIQTWADMEGGYSHTESYFKQLNALAGQQIWTEFYNQDGSGTLSIFNHQMIAIRVA